MTNFTSAIKALQVLIEKLWTALPRGDADTPDGTRGYRNRRAPTPRAPAKGANRGRQPSKQLREIRCILCIRRGKWITLRRALVLSYTLRHVDIVAIWRHSFSQKERYNMRRSRNRLQMNLSVDFLAK